MVEEKEFIMSKKSVATIYNPNLLSKNELISNYVVRLKKFQQIFKDIKSSKMERPEQHLLIEGQRGMGKTTLLLRLSYEVENDSELNQWLIPISFNEEQYNVSSLSSLWELIAQHLEDKSLVFAGLFDEMDSNYVRFEDNERAYEKFVFELLIRALCREDKKILVFIDNFGGMFSKLENESQRLREILMTCEHIRIIAASSLVSEAFFKYDEPLYEFLKIERLKELTLAETKLLLLKLGETYGENRVKEIVENEPERIETLRRLTGGVIRTIVLLYEIFVDNETGNAFKDLESVLDRVTPLYKHRMDDLSPQHQRIVHTIALNWDAMPTKEIAKKTRIPSGAVSAQLKKLVSNGLVLEIKPPHTKNKLYIIRERFFNIWYLMRNGRKGDKNRVIWLARFFESWLSIDKLQDFEEEEKLLIEEAEKGDVHSMNSLAWNYYLIGKHPKKALDFSSRTYEKEKSIYRTHTHATIVLWNDKYEEAKSVLSELLNDIKNYEEFSDDIIDYILLSISKGQYEDIYELFNGSIGKKFNLKDRIKPVYYVLMYYMRDKYPLEYLKMGEELKETVEEIIEKVEEKKRIYA